MRDGQCCGHGDLSGTEQDDLVWPFRSGYEILQKSYIIAKSSRLIQSALPPSSYCRFPEVKAFHSKAYSLHDSQ